MQKRENPVFLFWKILWAFGFATGFFALIVGFFSMNSGMTGLTPPLAYAFAAFAACFALPVYTLPAYFAYRNANPKRKSILLLNIFLGWTVAGWLILLFKGVERGNKDDGKDRQ